MGCASHLSEHLVLLVGNAYQLLNKAIRKVPTQHIRYQQRLLERAPTCRKQISIVLQLNKQCVWSRDERVVAMET